MTPKQMLAYTSNMAEVLEAVKSKAVFVGLPKEKVGQKVYGDGMTVIRNGAIHEFGAGPIPQRSFLRVPFSKKRTFINEKIAIQYKLAVSGKVSPIVALGRIGLIAENISRGAFTSLGYGDWEPITKETARRKGSTQTLIDNGILKGAISSVVRNVT